MVRILLAILYVLNTRVLTHSVISSKYDGAVTIETVDKAESLVQQNYVADETVANQLICGRR